jgi:thioredoxin-related protein
MHGRWVLGVLLGLAVAMGTTRDARAGGWLRDVDHALGVAQAQQRPLVLFVSMDGCTHCYRMIETTFRDEHVRRSLGSSFVAAAIKGSERPELMKHLRIVSYPTTLVIDPSGQVVDQMVGYVDADQLQRRLEMATRPSQERTAAKPAAAGNTLR